MARLNLVMTSRTNLKNKRSVANFFTIIKSQRFQSLSLNIKVRLGGQKWK